MRRKKNKAIISLKNGSTSTYKNYIEVYDQIKSAIKDFRIFQARDIYGKKIEALNQSQLNRLKETFEVSISEIDNHIQ